MLGLTANLFAESETGETSTENIDADAQPAETSAAAVWLFTDSNLLELQLTRASKGGDYVLRGTTLSSGVTTPIVLVVNVTGVTYESLDEGAGFRNKEGAYGLFAHRDETRTTLLAVGGDQFEWAFVAIESSGLAEETMIGLATTLLASPLDACFGFASAVCGGPAEVCWIDLTIDCAFACQGDPGCHDVSEVFAAQVSSEELPTICPGEAQGARPNQVICLGRISGLRP